MKAYIRDIVNGTWSLLVGMAITIRYFFGPVVTLQYPHQTVPMKPRFRGHIDLVLDERKGTNKCIVCNACMKTCPSGCITLEGEKREGVKQKVLTYYQLDFTKCSLCGLCVEVCPTAALDFSKDYNLVGSQESEFVFDLLKRLEERKQ
ncbi:NuoI/complex I 23 kDa subunit family protein [Fundidesulfovibrio agrisoli]|uniref:NuoI/complex I 23 kDa subunit family protein n=1 Tax=Fundidesulfovibrio agrisoli TaxID=2922717 RepID=UPI001FACB1D9|nr:NADH-quinone oxidoreductase subunit I [Fundidesulfovibrio agrisoli]